MPRAKTSRAARPKAETTVLHMPEKGNGRNGHAPEELESEIRLRAYELYLQRGSNSGSEKDDWLSAEREVLARHSNQTHTA